MAQQFLFEIGTEELPAIALIKATKQFEDLVRDALTEARLAFEKVEAHSTPRRMAVKVTGLAEATEPLQQVFRGPAAAIAFDEQGNPTKAALGFARGKGLTEKDLVLREEDGKQYVFAESFVPAQDARELLPAMMGEVITKISWPRSQRWGSGHARFARPVRWLVALLGDEVVPVEFAGLVAGRTTRGHRLLAPRDFEIANAAAYDDVMREAFVVVSAEERARIIREGIAAIEDKTGTVADIPQGTFNEVVNLVEWPTPLLAHFDEEFLQVPSEIITDAMLEHQRYFPLYTKDGALTNGFVITSNGPVSRNDVIIDGNERVVRARLSDAAFFYHEDLKKPLEAYLPELEKVAFQEKLGSVADKVARIEELAGYLAQETGADEAAVTRAKRAGKLCKADLVTSAVVEFTSLQGVMGGYYATAAGEPEEVAVAITEHYRPRFAGDELPSTFEGKMVALADKLDTVCGIFAIGQAPTGSSDPFAVRRAAIGIINILLTEPSIGLQSALSFALDQYAEKVGLDFDKQAVLDEVANFFTTRMSVMAKEQGSAPDTIQAVAAVDGNKVMNPEKFFARIEALEDARKTDPQGFLDLATAYARAHSLADPSLGMAHDEALFSEVERALALAITTERFNTKRSLAMKKPREAFDALARLRGPIDAFFEEVMVMDEDQKLRENRLKLLNDFVQVFQNIADIGALVKK